MEKNATVNDPEVIVEAFKALHVDMYSSTDSAEIEKAREIIKIAIKYYEDKPSAFETLKAAFTKGPLFDGDLPSKLDRDLFQNDGVFTKIVCNGKDGFNACTHLGRDVYKVWVAIRQTYEKIKEQNENKTISFGLIKEALSLTDKQKFLLIDLELYGLFSTYGMRIDSTEWFLELVNKFLVLSDDATIYPEVLSGKTYFTTAYKNVRLTDKGRLIAQYLKLILKQ